MCRAKRSGGGGMKAKSLPGIGIAVGESFFTSAEAEEIRPVLPIELNLLINPIQIS